MEPLSEADAALVRAADGWVRLDALAEAEGLLAGLSSAAGDHPEALQLRWLIASKRGDWLTCLDLAERLVAVEPGRRFGWLHLAESLHRLGRTEEGYARLATAADALEPNATVPLQLARYACCLNRLGEARQWWWLALAHAAQSGHADRLRARALDDPDLAPLRHEIGSCVEADGG
jgi:tetratricopeptide (TPR) repeat protein